MSGQLPRKRVRRGGERPSAAQATQQDRRPGTEEVSSTPGAGTRRRSNVQVLTIVISPLGLPLKLIQALRDRLTIHKTEMQARLSLLPSSPHSLKVGISLIMSEPLADNSIVASRPAAARA